MIVMHFLKPEALSLRPFIALPLVAVFDLKKCALDFCEVESVMKMIFHSVWQNVRIARERCATLSNTPLLFFHMENAMAMCEMKSSWCAPFAKSNSTKCGALRSSGEPERPMPSDGFCGQNSETGVNQGTRGRANPAALLSASPYVHGWREGLFGKR